MNKQYTWKCKGLFRADADKVCEEIIKIGSSATPAEILEAAKDENSELHKCFEWDDTKAAEKYRLQQARHIVCNLVYKSVSPTQPRIRVFHVVESRHAYVPTEHIMNDCKEYQQLLDRALADLRLFRARYSTLAELEDIMDAIKAVIDS